MSGIDKFYRIFEREKLNNALDIAFERKPDITWIPLLMSAMSSLVIVIRMFNEIQNANSNSSEVPTELFVWSFLAALIFIGSSAWFFISIRKWLINKENTLEHFKKAVLASEIPREHNYVFIVKRNIGGKPKLLFMKRSKWGYMLPYHKSDNCLTVEQLQDIISDRFHGLPVNVSHYQDMALDGVIKRRPEEGYSKFSYSFYHVWLNTDFISFSQLLENTNELKNYSFKSEDELKNDLHTMKSNTDIVNYLIEERTFYLDDSFEISGNEFLPSNLKVVWNITDQCSFDCAFCATKKGTDSGDEISFKERIKIADELNKLKGVRLQFTGGDPLYDKESRAIIMHVAKYMIKSNISVTSTGVGLSNTDLVDIQQTIGELNISYDYPSIWSNSHRSEQYNRSNYAYIKKAINIGINVNILITLSQYNSDEKTISAMISELRTINANSITLLRLMPVGKQKYGNYPDTESYRPFVGINLFKAAFGNKVKLHCSFRAGLTDDCNAACNMLEDKIGIDNFGNVYACAWAGYLVCNDDTNPFFLGNILDQDGIENVFKTQKYEELMSIVGRPDNNQYCKIFSFLEDEAEGLTSNRDMYEKQHAQSDN